MGKYGPTKTLNAILQQFLAKSKRAVDVLKTTGLCIDIFGGILVSRYRFTGLWSPYLGARYLLHVLVL